MAATAAVTAFFSFPLYLISLNTGAEPGHTGGPFPGERSCGRSDCHNVDLNTGPGRVFITVGGAPISQYRYTPGETVQLTVRVEDPNQGRWGFQITARNAANACQSEGQLAPGESEVQAQSGTAVGECANPQYATHRFPKLGVGGQEFLVNWTAPATNVGPILFAAAGNAANGNNQRDGDRIYTMQESVEPAAAEPAGPPTIGAGGILLATLAPSVKIGAPLSILSIFGQNFAPEGTFEFQPTLEDGKVATKMAGVCVEIGSDRSPMFLVTPTQLNFQASHQIDVRSQEVTVIRNCDTLDEVESEPQTFEFAAATPAFFVYTNFGGQNGVNPIAALHGDPRPPGVVAPDGLFPGASPAVAGEIVSLFATGLGETNPPFAAGEIPLSVNPQDPIARVTGSVSVTIGGITLEDVFYVGVAPCCAGLYQVVVRVPPTLQAGQHPVVITVGGLSSPAGPFIPVQ